MARPSPSPPLAIDGATLDLAGLEAVARHGRPVVLAEPARAAVRAARRVVDDAVARGAVVYGVTTGFGSFADVHVPLDRLRELQLNLLRSHAAGVGPPLGEADTRALMLLRANVLAKGFSGVRLETLELLVELLNRRLHPVVPSQGSVGASGDLAPLAHLALVLVGEGECLVRGRGSRAPTASARPASRPLVLEPKEGLALINGTQLMTAVGGLAVAEALRLARSADVVGALTLDALEGTDVAFDPRIHAARPHPGQAASARNLRRLLAGSAVRESHRDCGRVQDAYSLRCMPQVHGAARDALDYVTRVHVVEMNAATDNPMVFAETGEILSGGNFHGQPVAIAADILAIAAAELGAISERRTERLVNPSLSGLPAFLAREGGPALGADDGAGDRGRPRLREQGARPPRERGLDPHLRGQGGPRLDGPDRRLEGRARRGEHLAASSPWSSSRLRGPRVPPPAALLPRPRGGRRPRVRERVPTHRQDRVLGPEIEALAQLLRSGAILAAAESACGTLE
jgi:histidine ammonia-lyase